MSTNNRIAARGAVSLLVGRRPGEGSHRLREWWPGLGDVAGRRCRAAAGADGVLVLLSEETGRITRMGLEGEVLSSWGGDGELAGPRGLALAADGSAVVADTRNGRIVTVRPDGGAEAIRVPASAFAQGWKAPLLARPCAVAVEADGTLAVADDTRFGGIARVAADGSPLGPVGPNGSGRCPVPQPVALAAAADGSLWAVSGLNGRIWRFDGRAWAEVAAAISGLSLAVVDVAALADGTVCVAVANRRQRESHWLFRFDAAGGPIDRIRLWPGFQPVGLAAAVHDGIASVWVVGPGSDVLVYERAAAEERLAA